MSGEIQDIPKSFSGDQALSVHEPVQRIDQDNTLELLSVPKVYYNPLEGAEEIAASLKNEEVENGIILPHGVRRGELLTIPQTLEEVNQYARIFGYLRRRNTSVKKPLVFAEAKYKGKKNLLISLSEQEIHKPENDGKITVYRYETPESLPLVMKYGYYQAPLRSFLYEDVTPNDHWGNKRVALAFDLNPEELNQSRESRSVFSLSFPSEHQIGKIKLPAEVRQFLGELEFGPPEIVKLNHRPLTGDMRTHTLLGHEALGTLMYIPVESLNLAETQRANDLNKSRELFERSIK